MTQKIACILTAVLLTVGFANRSDGSLVFSATSLTVAVGSTSVTTEIRVRSTTGTDTLQYFAIKADVVTVTGGRTLNFGASTQDGTNTLRTVSPYVLFDRGTAVTLSSTTFAFNATSTSVSFRDGVAISALSGGPVTDSSPVSPGSTTGLLVATLQLSTNPLVGLQFGDSFRIDLTALTSSAESFATGSPLSPGSLSFTGAATGRGSGVGTDLNLTAANFSSSTITAVPEPSTFAMLGLVAGLFGATKLRKRFTRLAS